VEAGRERCSGKLRSSFVNSTGQAIGLIDDVLVYKRKLTDEEAAQLAGETFGNV